MLASVGFDAVLRGSPVASLSGGWKMKLALGALHALGLGNRANCCDRQFQTSCLDRVHGGWQLDAKHSSRASIILQASKASIYKHGVMRLVVLLMSRCYMPCFVLGLEITWVPT